MMTCDSGLEARMLYDLLVPHGIEDTRFDYYHNYPIVVDYCRTRCRYLSSYG